MQKILCDGREGERTYSLYSIKTSMSMESPNKELPGDIASSLEILLSALASDVFRHKMEISVTQICF